ncbi:alpha/beta-hydrolase [Ascodesmis nigricans]|uniref:Alpha/beta-hydrolase n=1 Tax=Ascodesmis nigricans TaxID=341454 RepID=A0A4S2N0U3_9PEZI|nr:alpha/beta-hydrolase [Ascodesmis nigricans]
MASPDNTPAVEPESQLPPTHDAPHPAPRMGEHCVSERTDPDISSSGEVVKLGKTEVYISRPADVSNAPLLVLLTNAVGVHSVNNQVQADHFASAGYFVVMPDLFNGDAFKTATASDAPAQEEQEPVRQPSLLDKIKIRTVEGVKMFMIDMWLARHTPENTDPIIDNVLTAVKETYEHKEYAPSLGTYVVGYCFGGKYALRLAGPQGEKHGVVASAVAHGTLIQKEDFEGIKRPVVFACVENDPYFPDDIREQGRRIMDEKKADYQMEVFKGVPHGFAVYRSYPAKEIQEAQKKCFDVFVSFLNKR